MHNRQSLESDPSGRSCLTVHLVRWTRVAVQFVEWRVPWRGIGACITLDVVGVPRRRIHIIQEVDDGR